MDWNIFKPGKLITNLANGDLPTVKTENSVNVSGQTVALLTGAIILVILTILVIKKYL